MRYTKPACEVHFLHFRLKYSTLFEIWTQLWFRVQLFGARSWIEHWRASYIITKRTNTAKDESKHEAWRDWKDYEEESRVLHKTMRWCQSSVHLGSLLAVTAVNCSHALALTTSRLARLSTRHRRQIVCTSQYIAKRKCVYSCTQIRIRE